MSSKPSCSQAASAPESKAIYKILVLGDCNVGKTCVVHRFCDNAFHDTYISTIGVDFRQKVIKLDSESVKLQIWDTAGQERFRTLTTAYYRGAMGILLMYDVTNAESFNHLPYWLETIQDNASPNVVKVLAGNKCDDITRRAVDRTNGEKMAENFGMPFFEISCKQGVNIDDVFMALSKMIKERIGQNQILVDDELKLFSDVNLNAPEPDFMKKIKCNTC